MHEICYNLQKDKSEFIKRKRRIIMIEYRFDTQLLIEGENLSEDKIIEYITKNIEGDCLLAVGDEELIKIHFHSNTPWKVLEYCASLGDIHDIVVENMERQANGLQG
jgi:dihydroxyacetone kinase-like predicted kinase